MVRAYLIAVIRIDAVVLVIAMVLFVVVDVVIENHTGIPWILLELDLVAKLERMFLRMVVCCIQKFHHADSVAVVTADY